MKLEPAYAHPSDLLLSLLRNAGSILEKRVTYHEMRDSWLIRRFDEESGLT